MRFDPNKTYPYPVLRPRSSDYPHAEFQVEIQPDRIPKTTVVRVTADFVLSDPDLRALVEEGAAEYVLRIRAPATHHRSAHRSRYPQIVRTFDDGQLHGRIEVWGFLVATHDLPAFQAEGWHRDYSGMCFDIHAGAVLGEEDPKEYWVDTAEEAPIGTIIYLEATDSLVGGEWRCQLDGERVALQMSESDKQRFTEARNRLNGSPDHAYITNAVYLPALIWILQEADRGPDDYGDRRWYRSLDARLADCGCKELGSNDTDRLADAQKLFEQPFARLPLLTDDSEGA